MLLPLFGLSILAGGATKWTTKGPILDLPKPPKSNTLHLQNNRIGCHKEDWKMLQCLPKYMQVFQLKQEAGMVVSTSCLV